ncbi:hypothetical protein NQ317_014344 [Molorchus minor]|uniref:Coiled-coil domain-containing protein 151 n=1 Tax=Molorchus minor TaxID=1323400 RepID=A0ABQ9K5M6_9CUCU|nr:hypothetical protein NQ317_014344 [Molorchus minor]
MEARSAQELSEKLSELNKKIAEVKKKIQLSEGQRKALFEDCETERKSNSGQILKLKREITQLVTVLHDSTSITAKYRIRNKRIVKITGPLADKTVDEVQQMLDLQVIDLTKKLDLLRYRVKQRKNYLADLGIKYRSLLTEHDKKELTRKIERPVKKSTSELQNAIHAIEVQIREAMHIKNRYLDIRQSLKNDSDKYDSNIKKLEEDIAAQKQDIEKLQTIMDEATRMRSIARDNLLKEEKAANQAAALREREASEGRRLVNERKFELELLERRIFQVGKIPPRPEPEGAEDNAADEERSPTPPHPLEVLTHKFEILKQATEPARNNLPKYVKIYRAVRVRRRFYSDLGPKKETQKRLTILRTKSETEKSKLERKLDSLTLKLDSYKYAEVKEAERKVGEMDRIQDQIRENTERSCQYREEKEEKDKALKAINSGLQGLYLCINPLAATDSEPLLTLQNIKDELNVILRRIEEVPCEVEEKPTAEIYDEKWLPAPYSCLIRRTPLPATGVSPAPPPQGSDDEEDVPSRAYLKRHAQIVVDAKTRRKKMQLPKRS